MTDDTQRLDAPDEPPDPHTALYRQLCAGMEARHLLDELLTGKVCDLLHAQAQDVADALYLTCMHLDTRLNETLVLIHTFLDSYYRIVAHKKEPL